MHAQLYSHPQQQIVEGNYQLLARCIMSQGWTQIFTPSPTFMTCIIWNPNTEPECIDASYANAEGHIKGYRASYWQHSDILTEFARDAYSSSLLQHTAAQALPAGDLILTRMPHLGSWLHTP